MVQEWRSVIPVAMFEEDIKKQSISSKPGVASGPIEFIGESCASEAGVGSTSSAQASVEATLSIRCPPFPTSQRCPSPLAPVWVMV